MSSYIEFILGSSGPGHERNIGGARNMSPFWARKARPFWARVLGVWARVFVKLWCPDLGTRYGFRDIQSGMPACTVSQRQRTENPLPAAMAPTVFKAAPTIMPEETDLCTNTMVDGGQ